MGKHLRPVVMALAAILALTVMLGGCGSPSDEPTGGSPQAVEDSEGVVADTDGVEADAAEGDANGTDADEPTSAEGADEAEASDTDVSETPLVALHVEGTQLADPDGNPVQLRGISTHGLSWFGQYVNAELFGELGRDWGANVVRLALYTAESGGYCTDGNKDELYAMVQDGVRYAREAGLYVIVDWHILSDNNPLDHADEAEEFFSRMSSDLSDQDHVLYEICNEPNGGTSWADVKAYAERIIPAIRKNAPNAVVLVGTPEWCQHPEQAAADPLEFDNVLYTVHFYAATHKEDLRGRTTDAVDDGLPVFVSEFGICDASGNGAIDEDSANLWMRELDKRGVSYCMWNLSNKDESSSALLPGVEKTSDFGEDDLSRAGRWLVSTLGGDMEVTPAGEGEEALAADEHEESGDNREHASGDLTFSLAVENSWPKDGKTCYQFVLTLANEGEDKDSWQVEVPFDTPIEVVDGWNAIYEVRDGSTLIVKNESYNANLKGGESLTDIGFQLVAQTEPKLAE